MEPSQIELVYAAQEISAEWPLSYSHEITTSLTCDSGRQYGSGEYEANVLLTHQALAQTAFKSAIEKLFTFHTPFFYPQLKIVSLYSNEKLSPVLSGIS